jgi:hypothetical protein
LWFQHRDEVKSFRFMEACHILFSGVKGTSHVTGCSTVSPHIHQQVINMAEMFITRHKG